MKLVEFAHYFLPHKAGGQPYASSWRMTADEAARRGALGKVPGSEQYRMVPENDEERRSTPATERATAPDSAKPSRGR